MRTLFALFILSLVVIGGCLGRTKLPDESVIKDINVEDSDLGQDVLDDSLGDVDSDLADIEGSPDSVQTAVSDDEWDEMNQSLEEIDSMESDLNPSEYDVDTTV
ncbi:MAG TPA: hypothetical protein VJB90_00765 [Candidatus Nanoarchaeia archaeon]|nr:hypothetical protein [Candidatus Nanoarchaeia archaeon]